MRPANQARMRTQLIPQHAAHGGAVRGRLSLLLNRMGGTRSGCNAWQGDQCTVLCKIGQTGTWYTQRKQRTFTSNTPVRPPSAPTSPFPPHASSLTSCAGGAHSTKLCDPGAHGAPPDPGAVQPRPMRLAMHSDVHTWRATRPALSHVKPLHCIQGPRGLSLPMRQAPGAACTLKNGA